MEITEHYIDLKQVLEKKGVHLPGFVLSWANKLLHVAELNQIIYRHRDKIGLDFVHAFLEGDNPPELNIHLDVVHPERIPLQGSPIIAGNHPLGGPDGLALMGAIGRYRQDIQFPVTDFLMYIPQLRPLFIPIDKVHHNSSHADALEQAFAAHNTMLYFPAGLCSRKQKDGSIHDLEWKTTFIKKSVKYQRDVVPFFFEARNRNRFYNIANLRKKLGIKFGFEMALLPAEMFAQHDKRLKLIIGKPIPYSTFDKSRTPKEWAQCVQDYIYRLAQNPDLNFEDTLL